MTEALRLQVARLALDLLDPDRIKATIESLVDAGVYLEPFLPALVERHPRFDEVLPAFLAALDHHGIDVPDKDTALRQLIEHHLRDVLASPTDALAQLGRFMDEVYWPCQEYMADRTHVGDSHGIEKLLGLYWSAGDLRERQEITVNGQHGPQAWFELNRLIVTEAERWLAAAELSSTPRAPSGT